MAFTEGNSHGAFNGVTAVDVVAAPAAATRRIVRSIIVYNADSASRTVTLRLDDGGTERIIGRAVLAAGELYVYEVPVVLNATNKKIEGVLDAAPATTQPTFVSNYGDAT